MYDIPLERKSFSLYNGVMFEYIHIFVKSQVGLIWAYAKDTGIRIYRLHNYKNLEKMFFIYIIYDIMFK